MPRRGLGVIKDFTGISSPYEQPEAPELIIDTGRQSLQESVSQVIEYLVDKGVLKVLRDNQG